MIPRHSPGDGALQQAQDDKVTAETLREEVTLRQAQGDTDVLPAVHPDVAASPGVTLSSACPELVEGSKGDPATNPTTNTAYYNRPIVKPHVWTPFIPWYFWIGGTAGVAAVHAAIERARGNDALADVQRNVALAGALTAPILLTLDLGVPARFLNMLRVFKPTSPMSVGSWILTTFGGLVTIATITDWLGWKPVSRTFEVATALVGPALTCYTAVLIADTATPIWHDAYGELPFVFVASGIAGAGACGATFAPHDDAGSARRMMIAGAIGMTACAKRMERKLGPFLAEPYEQGKAGAFKRVSGVLGIAGAALGLLGRNSKAVTTVAATLVASSGVFERFAVLAAGKQSARDPKYTVEPQRARLDARGGHPSTLRQAQGGLSSG